MKIQNKLHPSEFGHSFCNFKYDSDVNGKIPTFRTVYGTINKIFVNKSRKHMKLEFYKVMAAHACLYHSATGG